MKFYEINAGFLKEVSSTSSGDTASRRILNTTHIIDPSYQLRCTAYMLWNKDKPVKCQLLLPTKRELYVSGRGTIHTNCTGNCMAARWMRSHISNFENEGSLFPIISSYGGRPCFQ
ncbi:hypothetical protein DPMN_027700 [Dreissena polymorpha]|uniref:Uncharacterized protein n=1 Tax=Dreissena polymorpha TaxID=45954 RepID=A0A9D4RDP6_DREPO|nr:hypothetical protein DPMN_027700 [Dreissena polymorpha]